jgi:hypothetical protein
MGNCSLEPKTALDGDFAMKLKEIGDMMASMFLHDCLLDLRYC